MATMTDMEALNIHIAALAKQLGLLAWATTAHGRVMVTVKDMSKTPPLGCSKSVTAFAYQSAGIHTFDDFIKNDAARELSRY